MVYYLVKRLFLPAYINWSSNDRSCSSCADADSCGVSATVNLFETCLLVYAESFPFLFLSLLLSLAYSIQNGSSRSMRKRRRRRRRVMEMTS